MYLKSKIAHWLLLPALIFLAIFVWTNYTSTCTVMLSLLLVIMCAGYVREEIFNLNKSNDKRNSN